MNRRRIVGKSETHQGPVQGISKQGIACSDLSERKRRDRKGWERERERERRRINEWEREE